MQNPEGDEVWSNGGMTHFSERLWPSAWLFLATALVIPASLLVFLPINANVGVAVALLLYGACTGLLILAAPRIEVTDVALKAGRATLPLEFAGEASAYRKTEATAERGVRLDARAYLVLRGWVDPVVRIPVADDEDPVPYWLVSTRRPDELVAALERARPRTPGR